VTRAKRSSWLALLDCARDGFRQKVTGNADGSPPTAGEMEAFRSAMVLEW